MEVSALLLLTSKNIILTGEDPIKRQWIEPNTFGFCNTHKEYVNDLLLQCLVVRPIWEACKNLFKIRDDHGVPLSLSRECGGIGESKLRTSN